MVRAALPLLVLLASCSVRPAVTDLYYWKTTLEWSDTDTRRCDEAGVDRVGLRLFDWGVRGVEGPLVVRAGMPATLSVVPVVYVTEARLKAWAGAPDLDASAAARELWDRMRSALSPAWPGKPTVWQLDADWTATTREAWFAVVAAFGNLVHAEGARLEVTVRLHQVRDRATQGVPPSDGGVLMLYGTGETVLDLATVKAYLTGAYPLPLVPAFPAYTQVRQLNGYGRLVALHRLSTDADLPRADLEAVDTNHFRVLRRSSLGGRPLLAHDELWVDRVDPSTLEAVARLSAVDSLRRDAGGRVWVFDYDPQGWDELRRGPLSPLLFPR